ncbi:MAG: hypothetical protein JNK84_21660 [Phreatobacter sp.]|uniref:hypothetical protein n=1 Tax=Phreatobacter sp. TaxID=1966341 RepID=UPI001A4D3D83|nr:hypothetical protein [Phreatobacter sp.]MBL8571690.1 hypothetical protein [Phreatobacter sp.]
MMELRSPDQVMRLDRLGASHPTRISFLRAMLRRVEGEGWRYSVPVWEIDADGYGHAVLQVDAPAHSYSLVAFSTPLDDAMRTDRVIAEAWDTSYVLYDGVPDACEIARLRANAPRQEAGRYSERDLILSRANKSVRLFAHVVETLAEGRQPDAELVESVGYLMRTTAVYGNGKFGIADRDRIAGRPEFSGPFRAEMLSVWLIRSFTIMLAEHVAAMRGRGQAARLDPAMRRSLGVGNSTGLGMAPFLVKHPLLVHRWFHARETAVARVRARRAASEAEIAAFMAALATMRENVRRWRTEDPVQAPRVARLADELAYVACDAASILRTGDRPWNALYQLHEAKLSPEGQEAVAALILEPHGALVDDLADAMDADEDAVFRIDGAMACGVLREAVDRDYGWAKRFDFASPAADARFWYVSEEKLEPRLGERHAEEGAGKEQPLAVARDVTALAAALADEPTDMTVAAFLMARPEWRHVVRRVQIAAGHPYAEVRDNLIGASMRPVDLLRAKLAFFGASRFDPRSDRWLRISLFADAPFPEDICRTEAMRAAS